MNLYEICGVPDPNASSPTLPREMRQRYRSDVTPLAGGVGFKNKQCLECGQVKPVRKFCGDSRTTDGYSAVCRKCRGMPESSRRSADTRSPSERRSQMNLRKRDVYHKTSDSSMARRYQTYRYSAMQRGYEFDLTLSQFSSFWKRPCHYCGSDVATVGLDRVDNEVGYVISNVVSCCPRCNRMKLDMSMQTWISHMRTIIERAESASNQ